MSEHSKRAKKRAEGEDPINFTCGKCMQVHKFNEGYLCDFDSVEEEAE